MGNKGTHTTVVVIPSHEREAVSLASLPRVRNYIQSQQRLPLPHPESPLLNGGTSTARLLYALGHDGNVPRHEPRLRPDHWRQLRHVAYMTRQQGGRLHVYGVIDHDSPYGSRWGLEETMRFVKQAGIPTSVHIGVWHPTPQEFHRGLRELMTLADDLVQLHSLFSVRDSIDPLQLHDDDLSLPHEVWLPVRQGYRFIDSPRSDTDTAVVLGYTAYRWHPGVPSTAEHLVFEQFAPPSFTHDLDKHRQVVTISSHSPYIDAFCGEVPHHGYYEQLTVPSSEEVLEILLSPHSGYDVLPHATHVLVENTGSSSFDWLLASYLKKLEQQQNCYNCIFLNPASLHGNLVVSNRAYEQSGPSLYRQLHYCER